MIFKIFIAVLLLELVSVPIVCAVIDCGIRYWYKHRMKYLSDLLIFAGQQLSKREGAKTNDQSGNV